MKKYKLTDEYITIGRYKLYRIEALKDFSWVKKGDKGGFIESEENLSHFNNCWIYGDAKVYGNAMVFENAKILNNSKVSGYAWVYGNAIVYSNALVYDRAKVFGNASVHGSAEVYGNAKVLDKASVFGDARVYGNALVCDRTYVYGNANVSGNAKVCDKAEIYGNAEISNSTDYIVFKNRWSSNRYFTWTRSNNMWRVGCFYGTGAELIAKAYKDSELSGREYERVVKYVESILKDNK